MICCYPVRAFRASQRVPHIYVTTEAARFGTQCPNNLETRQLQAKFGTYPVRFVKPVTETDPLVCFPVET